VLAVVFGTMLAAMFAASPAAAEKTVPVNDPAVLDDVNTPESYRRLLRIEDSIRQ